MILVTGATGFVGNAVLARIGSDPAAQVRGAGRRIGPSRADQVVVGDLGPHTEWAAALRGVDAVVHTAARVHVMQESAPDPLAEFRRVNVEGTANLARQAAEAGVRRFVFLSSIKVNGESTSARAPYTADDVPAPVDAYGISKYEAEQELAAVARVTGLEVVIIRSVLVYGPGVKGNVLSMMRWLRKGIPLPFGAVRNQRSLVGIDNLVDLIVTCLNHPSAANQIFLVSDGEDLSTPGLLRCMAEALGRPARLIPVPMGALQAAARLSGRTDVAQRLLGSLQVDITTTKALLGWTPPVGASDAIIRTARHFLSEGLG